VDRGDAVVGDGDPMGITAEVIKELFGGTKRSFRVHIVFTLYPSLAV
jgi:hypothetical protein